MIVKKIHITAEDAEDRAEVAEFNVYINCSVSSVLNLSELCV